MRKTIGKLATLDRIAAIGKINEDELIRHIIKKIKEVTGEDIGSVDISTTNEHLKRRQMIKNIINDIHKGRDVDEIKQDFADILGSIGAHELSQIEQELIEGGMEISEVQKMCNIHSKVFKDGLKEQKIPGVPAGHPVHIILMENGELKKRIAAIRNITDSTEIKDKVIELKEIDLHYKRKENQLFPLLEKHNISGPSKVMWGKHDEIRKLFKTVIDTEYVEKEKLEALLSEVEEMIIKEEQILIPMALEILSDKDWQKVKEGEKELGYVWIKPKDDWIPQDSQNNIQMESTEIGEIKLEVGHLSPKLLNLVLCHLPIEISFVNENDEVVYYNQTKVRLFPRTPAVIGRKIQNCHPQNSVHIVNEILSSFKNNEQDVAEFWLQMNGKFIHIRYFAVRDINGKYRGCLESTQDVSYIRSLKGERRLLEWN